MQPSGVSARARAFVHVAHIAQVMHVVQVAHIAHLVLRALLALAVIAVVLAACTSTGSAGPAATPRATAPATGRAGASTAPAGVVQVIAPALAMPGLGRERTLRVYLPPGYAGSGERYPVIYMHDGQNLFDAATSFSGAWDVGVAMDALARTRGFEAIVVGIDHGGAQRASELNLWPNARLPNAEAPAYLAFVVDTVKPWVDAHYRTRSGPGQTAIIGSSLGALVSQAALLRYPQVFGKAALLSPAYWIAPQLADETRTHRFAPGTRVWLSVGTDEDTDTEALAREMHALLRSRGLADDALMLQVTAGGHHDEAAWRAAFPRAVAWLFDLPPAR